MSTSEQLAKSIFRDLSAEKREELLAASRLERYPAGAALIREGQKSEHVFLLISGAIRVFHMSPAGLELVVMFCRSPALFGEIEALLRIPHIENVTAMTDAELLLIPHEVFNQLLGSQLEFANLMVWDLCAKLAMASHNQKALAFQDVTTRLATLLLSYAVFDGRKMHDGIQIRLAITQEDMANALGVTRRAVSKTITSWLDDGILSKRDNRYLLKDLPKLIGFAAIEHIGLTYDNQSGLTIIQPEEAPDMAKFVKPR